MCRVGWWCAQTRTLCTVLPPRGQHLRPITERQALCSLLCGLDLGLPQGKSLVRWDPVRGEACCPRGLRHPPQGQRPQSQRPGSVPVDSEPDKRSVLEGQAEERRPSASKVKNRAKDLAGRGPGLAEKADWKHLGD